MLFVCAAPLRQCRRDELVLYFGGRLIATIIHILLKYITNIILKNFLHKSLPKDICDLNGTRMISIINPLENSLEVIRDNCSSISNKKFK